MNSVASTQVARMCRFLFEGHPMGERHGSRTMRSSRRDEDLDVEGSVRSDERATVRLELRVIRACEDDGLDERHELIASGGPKEAHPGVVLIRQEHDRRNAIDAVLQGPILLENEIALLDANEIVEAGELVQDLAGDQRGFGRANRLREQQQRHWLLNLGQVLPDDALILFGQQTHVISFPGRGAF